MIKRIAACCAWLAACGQVWALDVDIRLHIQSRQAQVAPQCASVLARAGTLPPHASYQRALCLLYGLQTPANPDAATKLLRALAEGGMTEAQMALADTLQQGDTVQQQEAVQWYSRAAAAGDVRAAARQSRLAGRLQAAADAAKAASTPAPSDPDDPYADMLNNAAAQQPGYHCHFYGLGKRVCHGGMD
ncbi:MAG: SEL1-like repeat protein [Rhodoferax sp.]|nr:SEL1-like repeat protein [Rhodoferax sp.]